MPAIVDGFVDKDKRVPPEEDEDDGGWREAAVASELLLLFTGRMLKRRGDALVCTSADGRRVLVADAELVVKMVLFEAARESRGRSGDLDSRRIGDLDSARTGDLDSDLTCEANTDLTGDVGLKPSSSGGVSRPSLPERPFVEVTVLAGLDSTGVGGLEGAGVTALGVEPAGVREGSAEMKGAFRRGL